MSALDALRQPGPDSERVVAAMESLAGIVLTGGNADVVSAIERFGLHYNSICRSYPPADIDTGIPSLSEDDTADLMSGLRAVCELIRDSETERILARLRHHQGKLPEAEIIQIRQHREWFVPLFIQECRDEIDKLKGQSVPNERSIALEQSIAGHDEDKYNSIPFFALYLFSEWDIHESIPIVLECFRLPGDGPFDLFGDGIHDQVPRYLAQFLSSDLDRIDEIICDPGLNEYLRWAAAGSYLYLVRDQNITVDDAIARLANNYQRTMFEADDGRPGLGHCYELSSGILENLYKLGGSLKSIPGDENHSWKFVDEGIFSRRDAETPLSGSELQNELLLLSPTRIPDCLECIRDWAAFERRPKPKPRRASNSTILDSVKPSTRPTSAFNSPIPSDTKQVPNATGTIRTKERVPRNAKCPCGSGKKFKQCCMRS